MWFGQDIRIEEDMSEAVEGGAALAWRLLATLEGGSILLATSALLAYTVRKKIAAQHRTGRDIRRVLVTNTTNLLGRELKRRLERRGCTVTTIDQVVDSGVISDLRVPVGEAKVDAIVVVGAEPKADGLDGMARLVTEDVYDNLKLLESLSWCVHRGGRIAWACAGDTAGAFSDAGAAFDTVLWASLKHVAKVSHCEPIWVGRCEAAEQAAKRVVAALTCQDPPHSSRFSVRNAAHRVGERLCRWLKIVT
ncbi:uncharacterized protein LOC118275446 isoform X1 [Spodoptera frugiperda]|uniref:Uncharacterized protein LOC118275446 isoform X1 n=2 Tax=Spodoptera frugiperda TaxID=7108 RepID=A0A9R0DDJ6_SPOFR|nr:uncharacterized protein LOC118275446 isoform X1 [Spodoptera frugiperda]